MLPPKNDPDYEERLKLRSNIRDMWDPLTKDSSVIPKSMRYNESISTWPLPILQGISALASDMPGDAAWNEAYDLLEEGQKKRMKDKSNALPAQLQLSDLDYVRQHAGRGEPAELGEEKGKGKGKAKTVDEDEEVDGFNLGENDSLADPAGDFPNVVTGTKAVEGIAQQQRNDRTSLEQEDESSSVPQPILPDDTEDKRFKKWNLWIQYYWNVTDCRALIPEDMLQRGANGKVAYNRELENYQTTRKGEILELLYELAQMTGLSQKDAAWAKIRDKWDERPWGKDGYKAITVSDVKYAIHYFQCQGGGGAELTTAAQGAIAVAAPHSDKAHNRDKVEGEADQEGDEEREDTGEGLQAEGEKRRS
ncbi:hypothetical protein G6011_04970 [Alternaria panax]|uniref:Uncharacterized protein n=1 Tax=Alternaria panax TaxID=48097 RepID=A0AAD4FGF3_9PLEO|nr:hypothetical protein G6011_04970 [Alternaria panax]